MRAVLAALLLANAACLAVAVHRGEPGLAVAP